MIKLNGYELGFGCFPNGETRVNHEEILKHMSGINQIEFKYENDSDLIKLMFVKNYLDDLNKQSTLTVYYLPYSRQDRSENQSVFTLKYICNFINSLNFDRVIIIETHSDVSPALLHKSVTHFPTFTMLDYVIKDIDFNKEDDYLFFPDATAQKRYGKIEGYKQLAGFKQRDFSTGKIKGLQIVGDQNLEDKKIIIWDDLCSYGGTFLLSAQKLKELGASEIYLMVGHCEDSVYEGELLKTDHISKIYTTNTILNEVKNDKIKLFDHIGGII